MTELIDYANFGIATGGFFVAIMGLFLTCAASFMEKGIRAFFKTFFSILIIYVSSDLISQISLVILGEKYKILSQVSVFFESLFSAILLPMLLIYLLRITGEDPLKKKIFYLSMMILLFYIIILVATQFSQKIYYISEDNIYHRGPLYSLLLVPPAILMLIDIAAFLYRIKLLNIRQKRAFSIYLFIPLICMLVQMNFYGLLLIVIGTTVSSFFMFLFILSDQLDYYLKQREETLGAQAEVMMLQMRPHFIYNTMTSIYYLCEQNPSKAMKTIEDFTNYLRKNFSSISKKETIPFSEELSHVQAYLSIEQTRFEGRLFVEFDTPHTAFRIPPLTLQPIVENSVKYGVDPESDPLYISITTREKGGGSEIIVTDTGPGFDENEVASNDNREPHIALSNIRERLKIMCKGTISISTCDSGGTIVSIYIPNK